MAEHTFWRQGRSAGLVASQAEMINGLPQPLAAEWLTQQTLYGEFWRWMDGDVWDEVDKFAVIKGQDKTLPLLFPIQLNPLYTAAKIHQYTLFGEVPDSGSPMVKPIAIPKFVPGSEYDIDEGLEMSGSMPTLNVPEMDTGREEAMKTAAEVSHVLDLLWYQSNGRTAMLDNAFISQALGGCVWKVSYEPQNQMLEPGYPIAFRAIEPEFFLPIYSPRDRFNLLGARMGRMIDRYEAREEFGVEIEKDQALYLEDWTRRNVKVTLDGKPLVVTVGQQTVPLSTTHDFQAVPFVYMPHELIGGFYGVPLFYQTGALLKEINGRIADVGDAIRNSIERIFILTNCDVAEVQKKDLGDGLVVLTTGREAPGTAAKRIDVANPPSLPGGTEQFLDFLQKAFWHSAFTPAVAYGEDEGSQRSALTLAFRMWPLTSHVRSERSIWTEGLRVMGRMALRMLQGKQREGSGVVKIEDRHQGHQIKWDWAPMIPRDREAEVNQIILRHQDDQLSADTAMEMMGDIPDTSLEGRKILTEGVKTAQLEAAALAAQPQPQFGGGGGGSKPSGSTAKKPSPRSSE